MNRVTQAQAIEMIEIASKLSYKAHMADSAQLCLDDARRLLAGGDPVFAFKRAQRCLDYSIGVHASATFACTILGGK